MFDTLQLQNVADILKGHILDITRVNKRRRMDGLRAIQRLENCAWNPDAMQEVFEACPLDIQFKNRIFEIQGDQDEILDAIEKIIEDYIISIGGCDPSPFDDIFDMHEAAAYLGISYDMMKTYVSREHRIRGTQKGRTMLFTRAQLDDFRDNDKKPQGRPAIEEEYE